jgi:hypothetical protein
MPNFVPLGYSGASAIAMVQNRVDEYTLPTPATILSFLNAGIEQVTARMGGIHLFQAYPVLNGQNLLTLNNDVQDIVSASYSTGDPTGANPLQPSTVYPLEQFDPIKFMDFAAGYPGVGAGPPTAFLLTSDFGTGPSGSLPAPQTPIIGQVGGVSTTTAPIYAVTTYVNPAGESTASLQSQPCVLTGEFQAQVSSPPQMGNSTGYRVYASTNNGGPYFFQGSAAIGSPVTLSDPLNTAGMPPTVATASYPSGGFMVMQLYPPAMAGQVNLYYRGRPALWADTTANSFTNLDSMAQEAAILWAMCRVLENRGRGDEAKDIYMPQLAETIEEIKTAMQRRLVPKSGQVRDVSSPMHGSTRPFWY